MGWVMCAKPRQLHRQPLWVLSANVRQSIGYLAIESQQRPTATWKHRMPAYSATSSRCFRPARQSVRILDRQSTCVCPKIHTITRRFSSNEAPVGKSSMMAPKLKKIDVKTPKGTRDWAAEDMVLRDEIFSKITQVFQRHGGQNLDTPVFELKDILTGKYGEDSKLIYNLADQGGEATSLRYDLTVPFARYLAMNKDIQSIKRYHIAKVYRRDQPAVAKGRMREFYQCDFDTAGTYDRMIPDAEIIRIISEVFSSLGWEKGEYTIKTNHRAILDGLFSVCGVPETVIRPISSAVDKLDKMPWSEVRAEMLSKGLDEATADKIGSYVGLKGQVDLVEKLESDDFLKTSPRLQEGLADMRLLFDLLGAMGVSEEVSFDLSLARGLDYYTGIIYEVVTEGSAPSEAADGSRKKTKKGPKTEDEDGSDDPTVGIGSIAAGGRYDGLVSMFRPSGNPLPCVGISFGVDRIFTLCKKRMAEKAKQARKKATDVFVMAFGNGLLKERIQVCTKLWDAGIHAEFLYKNKPKLPAQFKAAEQNGVPYAVILGESELAEGKVRLKQMGLPDGHPEKDGILVDLQELTAAVRHGLDRLERLHALTVQAEGLTVVCGIKEGEQVRVDEGDRTLPSETSYT